MVCVGKCFLKNSRHFVDSSSSRTPPLYQRHKSWSRRPSSQSWRCEVSWITALVVSLFLAVLLYVPTLCTSGIRTTNAWMVSTHRLPPIQKHPNQSTSFQRVLLGGRFLCESFLYHMLNTQRNWHRSFSWATSRFALSYRISSSTSVFRESS